MKNHMISYALVAALSVFGVTSLNMRPIIGVLTQHTDSEAKKHGDSYIYASYFKYIEMAGARAVPILTGMPEKYYEDMFLSLNGVLFPGGGVDLQTSYYSQVGRMMYNWSIIAYDKGDYFPIWGTCEGFQLLADITAGMNVLSECKGENMTLSLNFTSLAASSRMYGTLPADLRAKLASYPLTQNNHHYCLLNSTYESDEQLKEMYSVLSTNTDPDGRHYISSMEAKRYPIYAVQYHPEKNIFQWSLTANVNHDLDAVRLTQYLANMFVHEARKSSHKFHSLEEEVNALIENYTPVFFKDSSFSSVYYFNYTYEKEKYEKFVQLRK